MRGPPRYYRAIVLEIEPNGRHGPFVFAWCQELRRVTFSLVEKVWREQEKPEPGIEVILWDIRLKPAGWRAYKARFFRPEDRNQQQAKSIER